MKLQLVGSGLMVGALLSTCLLLRVQGQDAQTGTTARAVSAAPGGSQSVPVKTAGDPSKQGDGKTEPDSTRPAEHSAGVDEILKMVQAGVSAEVIRTYIENSPIVYSLSAADVIALKEHAVPDELTMAMMKRGAALKTQARPAVALNAPPPAQLGSSRRSYRLDPESYDYFQYYYLYPRTLAAANQRFYSSDPFSPGFAPYGSGYSYYGPPAFWPQHPSAFAHP